MKDITHSQTTEFYKLKSMKTITIQFNEDTDMYDLILDGETIFCSPDVNEIDAVKQEIEDLQKKLAT